MISMKGVAMPTRLDQIQIFEIIINELPLGFSVVDSDGIIVDFNGAAEKITGYDKDEVMGKFHYEILHGTSDTEACPLLHQAIRQRREAIDTESSITNKNGDTVILSVTAFPLVDDAGTFLGGVELFRDVTAEKNMEREQKNILSMFAHDMKNPVLVSEGLISRLLSGKAGKLTRKQEEYLTIVQDNLNKVERLLMDFLDFARLKTKEYKPIIEYFDLRSAIQKVIQAMKVEADKKSIMVNFFPPEGEPVMIHADPMMLDRVMTNLVCNALQYTNTNGTIKIELLDREKNVAVHVADTGIGIPETHLPHIFDAYFRVNRDSTGSGLGLAITKTIIEAHGGKIWVTSSVNAGTSFHFLLPKKES